MAKHAAGLRQRLETEQYYLNTSIGISSEFFFAGRKGSQGAGSLREDSSRRGREGRGVCAHGLQSGQTPLLNKTFGGLKFALTAARSTTSLYSTNRLNVQQ